VSKQPRLFQDAGPIHWEGAVTKVRAPDDVLMAKIHLMEFAKVHKQMVLKQINPHAHRTHARIEAEIQALEEKIKRAKLEKLLDT